MIFENLNVFRKIDVKYDEIWLVNKKYFTEVEPSLLKPALNLSGLYEYWFNLKKRDCKNQFYCGFIVKIEKSSLKNSEKKFNLKKDPHNLAENFIRI